MQLNKIRKFNLLLAIVALAMATQLVAFASTNPGGGQGQYGTGCTALNCTNSDYCSQWAAGAQCSCQHINGSGVGQCQ